MRQLACPAGRTRCVIPSATRPRQSTCRRRAPSIRHLPESKMHPCGSKSPSTETSRTGKSRGWTPSRAAAERSRPPTPCVLDGVVSAYDSYQSDSYHHPEMGQGEKVARAGVMGAASATGAYLGATYGAQLGAAIGAVGGPVGILAGGVIGGIIGGLGGSKLGQTVGNIVNNGMHSLINSGGSQS